MYSIFKSVCLPVCHTLPGYPSFCTGYLSDITNSNANIKHSLGIKNAYISTSSWQYV